MVWLVLAESLERSRAVYDWHLKCHEDVIPCLIHRGKNLCGSVSIWCGKICYCRASVAIALAFFWRSACEYGKTLSFFKKIKLTKKKFLLIIIKSKRMLLVWTLPASPVVFIQVSAPAAKPQGRKEIWKNGNTKICFVGDGKQNVDWWKFMFHWITSK